MSIQLNHTIVHARDKVASASFLSAILGLPEPVPFGPFMTVRADNGVTLDYYETDGKFERQHYAFLVGDDEFDPIWARIRERGMTFWADPMHQHANTINTRDGGRGLYFEDPDGHNLEILTRPYGSAS
jgi:catechol 2,3-dioxygenase-like lactoylglutathione lyase family enzyme